MKWNKYFILNIEPDNAIVSGCVRILKSRYGIPSTRNFYVRGFNADLYSDVRPTIFDASPLSPTAFATVDRASKLMIVGHGTAWGLCEMDLGPLADLLEKTGLREVGLISFKACLIGKLSSLDILSLYLKIRKINHGWLIGYLENALLPLPKSGNPWHIRIDTDEDMYLHSEFGYKSADCDRIRLVKGNIDVILPGTRRFSSTSPRLCTRRLRLT